MPDPHFVPVRVHGRYLVRPPADGAAARAAVVGFHGYGQRAEDMLGELEQLPGAAPWLLVSVEGLNRFYIQETGAIVAHWITHDTVEQSAADNVAYVEAVVAAVAQAHPFERLVFLGFSQGATMASRAAAHAGERCHGLILLGGEIAPEVLAARARLPRTIVGRGSHDEWYKPERFAADCEALEERGVLGAAIDFTGGHEFSPLFRAAASALVQALA